MKDKKNPTVKLNTKDGISPKSLELLEVIKDRKKQYLELLTDVRSKYFKAKVKEKKLTCFELAYFNTLTQFINNL